MNAIKSLEAKIDATKDVVDAFNAVRQGSKFVVWLSSLVAAFLVIWAAVKVAAIAFVQLGVKQ